MLTPNSAGGGRRGSPPAPATAPDPPTPPEPNRMESPSRTELQGEESKCSPTPMERDRLLAGSRASICVRAFVGSFLVVSCLFSSRLLLPPLLLGEGEGEGDGGGRRRRDGCPARGTPSGIPFFRPIRSKQQYPPPTLCACFPKSGFPGRLPCFPRGSLCKSIPFFYGLV